MTGTDKKIEKTSRRRPHVLGSPVRVMRGGVINVSAVSSSPFDGHGLTNGEWLYRIQRHRDRTCTGVVEKMGLMLRQLACARNHGKPEHGIMQPMAHLFDHTCLLCICV